MWSNCSSPLPSIRNIEAGPALDCAEPTAIVERHHDLARDRCRHGSSFRGRNVFGCRMGSRGAFDDGNRTARVNAHSRARVLHVPRPYPKWNEARLDLVVADGGYFPPGRSRQTNRSRFRPPVGSRSCWRRSSRPVHAGRGSRPKFGGGMTNDETAPDRECFFWVIHTREDNRGIRSIHRF